MIRIAAILTMLVDHIGACFFPNQLWLRAIGRISIPLFAYGIAKGYGYSVEHGTFPNYLMRLLIFTLVSQPPYMLFTGSLWSWNIGITWLASLIALRLLSSQASWPAKAFGVTLFQLLPIALHADGAGLGTILAILLYYTVIRANYPWYGLLLCAAPHLILAVLHHPPAWLFTCGILSYFLIYLFRRSDGKMRVPRSVAYGIYPVHLLLFHILSLIPQK